VLAPEIYPGFQEFWFVKQIFLGKGAAIAYYQQEATPTVARSGINSGCAAAFVSRS
jgi:hypothetical protein